jgi:hypothetical protein
MGLVTLTPYVAGNDVTAEGQNANENLIADEFNGKIDDVNVRGPISGTKIADAPSGIATAKINDGAVTTVKIGDDQVTAAKLADDAAVDANRAVTTNHIRNLAVTAPKIDVNAVISAKIKISTANWTPGNVNILTGNGLNFNTGLNATVIPLAHYLEAGNAIVTDVAAPSVAQLDFTLWWNTGTSTWWMTLFNDVGSGTTVNLNTVIAKMAYVMAS